MKVSFSLRAFVVYFIILACLSWFFLDKAIERLNVALRQSAESVLVDTANLLATSLEHEFDDQTLDTWEIERLFSEAYERDLNALIYNVQKDRVDTEVYITDRNGIVVYDSSGEHAGEDFSGWRDVQLTLAGQYGARTSFKYEGQTEDDDEKIMVIAAPIQFAQDIVGVVSVVKPIQSLESFLLDESNLLKKYAIGLLAVAMLFGYFVSHGFTTSIVKLANYANSMAEGKKVSTPNFMDKRFDNLSNAITHLRKQIDGKEYVEKYIHSLTHELKTPITAIEASSELLSEDMALDERRKFIGNIRTSNRRMSRLVDRMLSLAKLEGMPEVTSVSEFDLASAMKQLVLERDTILNERNVFVRHPELETLNVRGDPLLLQQAVANLLDNAIVFCRTGGEIRLDLYSTRQEYNVSIFNEGEALDDFVIERAFDRFFSTPPSGGYSKSTGLGLSFVREIMNLHHGTATLENTAGGVVAKLCWPNTKPA